MSDVLYETLKTHLDLQYEGIFSNAQIARHIEDYVQLELSEKLFNRVQQIANIETGQRLLDMGCGFGSFVLVSRQAGIDAIGIDIAEFDIDFAQKRIIQELPDCEPHDIYLNKNAQSTGLASESYDVITAWNLLEHVPNYKQLIGEAYRLLKPGGFFFGIAPNYFAFRQEAHYHVPWLPLLPRRIASAYLRLLGRRTTFFEQHIYYVTSWGVLRTLKKTDFNFIYPQMLKLERPDLITSASKRRIIENIQTLHLKPILEVLTVVNYWNPIKNVINFVARKPA